METLKRKKNINFYSPNRTILNPRRGKFEFEPEDFHFAVKPLEENHHSFAILVEQIIEEPWHLTQ